MPGPSFIINMSSGIFGPLVYSQVRKEAQKPLKFHMPPQASPRALAHSWRSKRMRGQVLQKGRVLQIIFVCGQAITKVS